MKIVTWDGTLLMYGSYMPDTNERMYDGLRMLLFARTIVSVTVGMVMHKHRE